MGKQDKRDKKAKKAKADAEAAIAAAVEFAKVHPDEAVPLEAAKPEGTAKVKKERAPRAASEDDLLLGKQVKELRDGGMAWWAIAYELKLPGSADNVAQGKSGASKARALYKKAFGALPMTQRSLAAKTGGAFGHGPKPKGERKRDVIRKDPSVASMFEDHTDIEIVDMLLGKRIVWVNSVSGAQEEAIVHAKGHTFISEQPSGSAITFREQPGSETPLQYRGLKAGTRTVRLSSIVKVAAR